MMISRLALAAGLSAAVATARAPAVMEIHRRRVCEATLVWGTDFSTVSGLEAFLEQTTATSGHVWSIADGCSDVQAPCWSKEAVVVTDGVLNLAVGGQDGGS